MKSYTKYVIRYATYVYLIVTINVLHALPISIFLYYECLCLCGLLPISRVPDNIYLDTYVYSTENDTDPMYESFFLSSNNDSELYFYNI